MRRRIGLATGLVIAVIVSTQAIATAGTEQVDDKVGEVPPAYDITSVSFSNTSRSMKAKISIPDLGTGDLEVTLRTYIDAMKPDGVAMRLVARRWDGEVTRSGLLVDAPDRTREYTCDGARARFRPAKGLVVLRLPTRCVGDWYGVQTMQVFTEEIDVRPRDHSRRVRVPFD